MEGKNNRKKIHRSSMCTHAPMNIASEYASNEDLQGRRTLLSRAPSRGDPVLPRRKTRRSELHAQNVDAICRLAVPREPLLQVADGGRQASGLKKATAEPKLVRRLPPFLQPLSTFWWRSNFRSCSCRFLRGLFYTRDDRGGMGFEFRVGNNVGAVT